MSLNPHILRTVRKAMDLDREPSDHRVVVAMSGGVDSSAVAGLLHAIGFHVVGITLQLYDHGVAIGQKGSCCAGRDIHDARRVAAALGIAHYVLDFENRFREKVIAQFADAYVRGETPIPCVTCNQTVKFADLLRIAKDLGASALATGHYISSSRLKAGGHRTLLTPADMTRDQSYFLYATTHEQADFLRFPLGSLSKAETRSIAAALGLKVAEKPDSQDICFVPNGRYQDVVARLRPEALKKGSIVHADGRILGEHDGIINFTVGQRRGIGIAGPEPLYVLSVNAKTQEVMVGPRDALGRSRIHVRGLNWLGDSPLTGQSIPVYVKIRSSRPAAAGRIHGVGEGMAEVLMDESQFGVSPGQACVFYENPGPGSRLLGGGKIISAEKVAVPVAAEVNPVVNRLETIACVTV